jgi:hypothetical protein
MNTQTCFPWAEYQPALSIPADYQEERSQAPATLQPDMAYFHGDLVRFTGPVIERYGRKWHEFVYLEGHKKGQTGHAERKTQ